MNESLYALSLLTPFDIDLPKIRIGPDEDGGYVLVNSFDPPNQPIMSYGIAAEYRFDREMAERGHTVFMFDHTIDGIQDAHPQMRYFKEGVAGHYPEISVPGVTDESRSLYTFADHMKRHDIKGDRIILKMDVEGAEFGAFLGADDVTLKRFEQITLELHSLESLGYPHYRQPFVQILEKLNSIFTLVHVHANNVDGSNTYHYVEGFPVSCLMELTFIRTNMVKRRQSNTVYPMPIDRPNFPWRDRLLWIFPFLPPNVTVEALSDCLTHVAANDPSKTG